MSENVRLRVGDRPPAVQMIPLGLQHLFAMFGATVLVPILTGLNPSVALLTSGLGTLLFILITGGQVPAYLGSSFAFIAPILAVSAASGPAYALGGAVAVGLLYAVVAGIIRLVGVGWLDRVLPPVLVGSLIVVIGLGLAPVGVQMAGLSKEAVSLFDTDIQIAFFTLLSAVAAAAFLRGFFAVIPILLGIVSGYVFALLRGAVDLTALREAAWIGLPAFTAPAFSWSAVAVFLPVAAVTLAEHLGDVLVLGRVVGKNFYKKPGLQRTLMGDGLATALAGLLGGPPNTTYGENIGVIAITKVYSVWVIGLAASFATVLAFVPKLGAAIQTIPAPVMGGVTIMLFGVIASSGIRTLVESGIDFSQTRNLLISSVVLVLGIGGAKIGELSGMGLAAIVGVILNLLLPMPGGAREGAGEAERAEPDEARARSAREASEGA
ncbi:solute carrier family 23 protein [Limnochorda pilosa]|uniref:Uracil transporter n=1 Tax=Limnochorda pilosa TaxID=1555112 RepID=A0A0K2SJW9_LIMPI|nr:solute carrier family 23 protein [Limnochorda pilosa]BAS27413.1 uracil transporter [Limnochorda pilosa]